MPFLHTLAVEQGTSIWDVIAILRHFVPTSDNLLSFGVVVRVTLPPLFCSFPTLINTNISTCPTNPPPQ